MIDFQCFNFMKNLFFDFFRTRGFFKFVNIVIKIKTQSNK